MFRAILIVLIFNVYILYGQDKKLDSLQNLLKTARHDTSRFNAYMGLGKYFQKSNPDTSIYFHTLAEKTAEKIPGPEGELRRCSALIGKGWDNYIKSEYEEAMNLFGRSLEISKKHQETKDHITRQKALKLYAATLGNIGSVYYA